MQLPALAGGAGSRCTYKLAAGFGLWQEETGLSQGPTLLTHENGTQRRRLNCRGAQKAGAHPGCVGVGGKHSLFKEYPFPFCSPSPLQYCSPPA